jgi:hypothetical protein
VEWQLVLQFVDTDARLKAARCSRQLLAAADHPFAWRHAEAVVVRQPDSQPPQGYAQRLLRSLRPPPLRLVPSLALPGRLRRSLLRHASILLRVDKDSSLSIAAIVALSQRLRELRIHADWTAANVEELLPHPALQQLRVLRLPSRSRTAAVALACGLLQLHSLSHYPAGIDVDRIDLSVQALQEAARLTALEVRCFSLGPPRLEPLGQMAQLHSLRLHAATFVPPGGFVRFCSSPMMRQLRRLSLDGGSVSCGLTHRDNPLSDADHLAALGALQRLEWLRLAEVTAVTACWRICGTRPHCPGRSSCAGRNTWGDP